MQVVRIREGWIWLPEQKKFVLYEHLLFLWKKKVFFIIFPLIFALLGFGATYLIPQEGKYVGTALIYKGSINLGELNLAESIITKYGSDVEGEIDLTTPVNKFIKIKITGDDEEQS